MWDILNGNILNTGYFDRGIFLGGTNYAGIPQTRQMIHGICNYIIVMSYIYLIIFI